MVCLRVKKSEIEIQRVKVWNRVQIREKKILTFFQTLNVNISFIQSIIFRFYQFLIEKSMECHKSVGQF